MKKLPQIPSAVHSPLGPVPVEIVRDLKSQDGEDALGIYNFGERKIKLRSEQPLATAWHTLIHEKVHMWLSDSGVSCFLTEKKEEQLCDAIATAIVSEMLNPLPFP